ncbi:ATP-dependent Clp protease ATP-binding subunit [Candidatus Peregrinibacteria bacterium]|nr:MAG: ATP-dependent Clp protease ATP-binding subunit [Candidatus Peregrinibacteria bacterium]
MDTENTTPDETIKNPAETSARQNAFVSPLAETEENLEIDFPANDEEFQKHLKGKVFPQLLKFFHPELLNRFDEIIFFHPLRKDELKIIVELMLREPREMLKEKNMQIRISDEAKMFISERGYDPAFGARPLRRAVQQYVEDPLSDALIRGDFESGDTIYIDLAKDGSRLHFRKDVADAQEKIIDPFAVLEQEPLGENLKEKIEETVPQEKLAESEKQNPEETLNEYEEKTPEQKESFFGKMFNGNAKPENEIPPQNGEKHIRFVDGRIVEE